MNKELIKKYKTEFDHWLNGGKVISKYTLIPTWSNCQSEDIWRTPDKNISKVLIVIKDEYATYRKALAEGKTIQYMNSNGEIKSLDEWDNIGWKQFKGCVENYRIKPEEPKFKVGDWVVEIHSTTKAQVLELFGNQIRVKFCYPDAIITTDSSDFIPWVPKAGDWCWFWDSDNFPPRLRQFKRLTLSNKYESYQGLVYFYCEPFLGKLPTTLKGVQWNI